MNNSEKLDKVLQLTIKNDVRCDSFQKEFDEIKLKFKDGSERITTLENRGKKTIKQHLFDLGKLAASVIGIATIFKFIPQLGKYIWP